MQLDTDRDRSTYDQLGEVLTKTDRNGNVHTYTYDVLGRLVSDAVTTLAAGVDGAVRRIETAYDGQGNPYLVTSYDAASGGNVVNQVERVYNGLGQLTQEYQAVGGAVNLSTTPYVGYTYSEMAGGANHSRLTQVAYPTATGASGKTIAYDYGTAGGLNDRISRLNALVDNDAVTVESYQYLGLGTVVERDHPEVNVSLLYIKLAGDPTGDAGDQYTGLDRFGRVADQRWRRVSGTVADLDRRIYTYDRDGNVLYAENASTAAGSAARSDGYTYDGLNQLAAYRRGTLTKDANGHPTGVTSVLHSQQWALDAVGNFTSQTTDAATQTRTHNKQNEILSVSGATTPTCDANGNLTRQENGSEKGSGVFLKRLPTPFCYYVDALICRDRDTDGNGTLDERLYAIQDANWNVVALVNTSGTVVERYQYAAYGSVTVLDGSWASRTGTSYSWKYLFQAGRWDLDADVYSFRSREFSPTLGRWLQPDSVGFLGQDLNLFSAYKNDPVNLGDPFGTFATSVAVQGALKSLIQALIDAIQDWVAHNRFEIAYVPFLLKIISSTPAPNDGIDQNLDAKKPEERTVEEWWYALGMTARFSFKYGNMTELLRKHLEWETRRRQDHGFDGCIANAYDGIIRELNNEDGRRRERAMYQLARLAQLNPYLVLALVRKSLDGELSVDLKERLSQFAGELLKRTGPIVVSPALLELLNQIIKRAADGLPEVEARLRALLGPIIVEF